MNDSIKSILSYVSLGCGALGALLVFLCGILTCALPKARPTITISRKGT